MAAAGRETETVWVTRVLGVPAAGSGARGTSDPRQGWRDARETAVRTLSTLEAGMRKSPHPLRDRAIIIVRAVRANLTAEPDSIQKVAELENYLMNDAVVAAVETPNVLGIDVVIRKPLLAALGALRAQVAS